MVGFRRKGQEDKFEKGWMPERQKADCDTALWLMLPCGLHTCSCALRCEEKSARIMRFCLFPKSMGNQTEGAKMDDALPSLLSIL